MKSIFSRTFFGLLASSLFVLTVMSFMVGFAIKASILNWNEGKKEELEALLIPIISKVHRLNGGLSEGSLESALTPYMTDSLYVYVFDEQKRPLFLLKQGKRLTLQELEKEEGPLQALLHQSQPLEIRDGDNVIGYLAVDSVDFFAYEANRQFVATMRRAVTTGTIITTGLTLVFSLLFSSSFSRQTKGLVKGITAMSKGARNVDFPSLGTREMNKISQSALDLQSQLSKEESLRRQWMQDISHDLRTPITAIKAQFEAMLDGVLDIGRPRLANLLTELNRVETLVRNLQELSRYESPEMKINAHYFQASAFLDDIRERFALLAGQKKITLCCEGKEFWFLIDEHLMQRCVSNIVQNALQHTQPGGTIRVTLESEVKDVVLIVENSGHIAARDLDRMFDRLYRGNSARMGGGSGLGLSIAKAIVDLHHGRIRAENSETTARFILFFPDRRRL
ncbi:sensor histidine kinase [Sediminispirochaeta bajacaliforniensis]|uniref:sensor histidine kinase n=1 Tax=Sediminispirochaeta bajacaliforniensis TaxID=148 RepID=UPI00036C4C26|nr:HAMP domain-containing sensor histidine kinase [Sediminispirochaeta bajacaliforniensis]